MTYYFEQNIALIVVQNATVIIILNLYLTTIKNTQVLYKFNYLIIVLPWDIKNAR